MCGQAEAVSAPSEWQSCHHIGKLPLSETTGEDGAVVGGNVSISLGGVLMFQWLMVLEKVFNQAFVDMDLLLGKINPDQADIIFARRQKMMSLRSCFT